MQEFLRSVASAILDKHGDALHQVGIVVPGNRAGLYLRRHLARESGHPVVAPVTWTLPEFVRAACGAEIAGRTELLFRLYESYRVTSAGTEPFAQFARWADVALDDFNDIEQALVDPVVFFRDLREIREIENWSFSQEPLSASQMEYLGFWQKLGTMHTAFRKWQEETGRYSYAYLMRRVAEGTMSSTMPVVHCHIVGLSGLSAAEERWIDDLRERGVVTCHWDADAWYLDAPQHEAGRFLRKRRDAEDIQPSCDLHVAQAEWTFCEAATGPGQVSAAVDLLSRLDVEALNDTAVVICEEGLLHPLLEALPSLPVPVNVAMGHHIRFSSAFKALRCAVRMHLQAARSPVPGIHYTGVLSFLTQGVVRAMASRNTSGLRRDILQNYPARLSAEHCAQLMAEYGFPPSVARLVGPEGSNATWLLESLTQWVDDVVIAAAEQTLEGEMAFRLGQALREAGTWWNAHAYLSGLDDLDSVLMRVVGKVSVPFRGEPLEGLQVLNMVETRAVDFRNVIILGANESNLPGNAAGQSLLPWDLRRVHRLPMREDREATYAYTFYRLLQRTRRAWIMYSAVSQDFSGTERSRYLAQLEVEIPGRAPHIALRTEKWGPVDTGVPPGSAGVAASTWSRERIRSLLASSFSPTALNTWLTCKQDFYCRYILALGQREEKEESMEASTFGSIVHRVLEEFYQPFVGSFPQDADFDRLLDSLPVRLDAALHQVYANGQWEHGENALAAAVAGQMIRLVVAGERAVQKGLEEQGRRRVIHAIEEPLEAVIEVEVGGEKVPVKLKGRADRIDHIDGVYYLIDYKSGKVGESDVRIQTSKNSFTSGKGKALQLMTYAAMWVARGNDVARTRAGLLSMIRHTSGLQVLEVDGSEVLDQSALEWYRSELQEVVKDMLTSEEYAHNESANYCEFCTP